MATYRLEGVADGGIPLAMAGIGLLGYGILTLLTARYLRAPRSNTSGTLLFAVSLCGLLACVGSLTELFAPDVAGKWSGFALKMGAAFSIGLIFCRFVLHYVGQLEPISQSRLGRVSLTAAAIFTLSLSVLLWVPAARGLFMVEPSITCARLCTLYAKDFGWLYPVGTLMSTLLGLYAVAHLWVLARQVPRVYLRQIVPISASLLLPLALSLLVSFGAPALANADLGMWGIALGSLPLILALKWGRLLEGPPTAYLYSLTERVDYSLTLNDRGRVVQLSPALVSLLGAEETRTARVPRVGQNLSEVFPELDPHTMQGTLTRSGQRFEVRHQVLGHGEGRLGDLLVLFDITERLAHESELNTVNKALEQSNIELKLRGEQLYALAHTDALTGLHNFRSFEARYTELLEHSRQTDEDFALILWDVDNFKEVNAHFTLIGGNEVLEQLAEVLRSSLPPGCFVCRLGGEEFVALLPDTSLGVAQEWVETVRVALEARRFTAQGRALRVGMSASPAAWRVHHEGMFYEANRSLGPIKYGAHLVRRLCCLNRRGVS